MNPPITFRPVTEEDLPLLHAWHQRPHVAEWWQPVPSIDELREDYLSEPVDPTVKPLDTPADGVYYLACENGVPFAYIQAYRVMGAHQASGWWADETDPHALGIDQFIAEADRLGKGLGTRMIRAFLDMLFSDPRVTKVQTDPNPTNGRAVACYRKAGFRDVGVVDTPDGPALLMRILRADHQA